MNNKIETGSHQLTEKIKSFDFKAYLERFYTRAPVIAWRFGLGPIVGHHIMIITQIDHKSGNPCNTSVEYFQINGIKYLVNSFRVHSKWYRNLLANPRVTIQTSDGTEQMISIPVTQDDELITIVEWLQSKNPEFLERNLNELGIKSTRKEIIKHKEDCIFIRFDPTSEPTPRGLEVDLAWIWPLLLIWSILTKGRKKK
ncbi:MAG TPA: nitroreductase/quinone reductase family protein [Anaerolineaceae bacterium]|nr:nitroreductase/quinone reductase family protein [Anaerolineaceae bacterium]